jgi:parvulin-like peptidyl-prolyl isomerase
MASRTSLAAVALVGATLLAGCGSSSTVATLCAPKVEVTKAQFNSLMDEGRAAYKAQKQPFPKEGTAQFDTLKSRVVALLVQHAEESAGAAKLGVSVTDKQVDKAVSDLVTSQFQGNHTKFEAALKKSGLTEAVLRDQLRSNLLQQAIEAKFLAEQHVASQEIKAYYDTNKAQYKSRPSRPVREIIVKTKGQALQVKAQLDGGADPAALAKKLSQDPNAKQTGGATTIQAGTLTTADEKLVFALAAGKASAPIRVGPEWAVVVPTGPVKPAAQVPLTQVRVPIVQYLMGKKRDAAVLAWLSKVQADCAKSAHYAKGYEPASTTTTTTATTTTTTG